MKRKTKRLLGVFGLAAVMVMTAIAYALPTPEAHAEDLSANADVTIQVKVVGPGSVTNLVKPSNDEVVKSNIVPVEYTYQKMKSVLTNLSCTGAGGAKIEQVVDTFEIPEDADSGTRTFNMDLNAWGVQPDASCRVYLTGKSIDDKDVRDEGAAFEYRAIKVDMGDKDDENNGKPTTDEKGDPEVTIGVSDDVYSLLLQVYDENGDPVFIVNGVEEPIIVSRDEFDLVNNNYKLNLPMAKYGAKSGWYELVAIAYGQDGKEVISMNVYRFYYDAGTPNVPGTGTIMDNLNISRADYVATGLIAFGAVAMFGVYLVARKSRR